MQLWIYFTILAALMQSLRTAGQKHLSSDLSAMATTLVRFLFAVPLVWGYLYIVGYLNALPFPSITSEFLSSSILASLSQIIATVFMIKAFHYKNFAVATSLAKTEAILTAIVGVIAFDAILSGFGWLSVIVGVMGVIILTKTNLGLKSMLQSPAWLFGVGAGLFFALATLWIRQASLALETNLMLSAAFTLAFMVSLQTVLVTLYLLWKDKSQFSLISKNWKLSALVGLTSMLGSVGWFTAASYQDAAYVKALGQIEFFFTLFITQRIFKEEVSPKEYIGMALIVLSVLILLLLA